VANASKKKGASSRGNKQFPRQHQARQPGRQHVMRPQPHALRDNYLGANKLEDKTALISGGDSGIGRSVAVAARGRRCVHRLS
jgi:hypothetical protein